MIIYKNNKEIDIMRKSNQIVAQILNELKVKVEPGVKTKELDEYAERRTAELGAKPAFKGYRGFPASLCTSINEEIVHGIPSSRQLRQGDIISMDFGVVYQGLYGDAALTVPVGNISMEAKKLIEAVKQSLNKGIEQVKVGNRISDISSAVQKCVESNGFSVIRTFVGHGIGFSLHEEPQVPNFGSPGHGPKIKPGMVLAIEPMISAGEWDVEILEDHWTAVTRDRSLSAHYENTVAATEKGPEVLSVFSRDKNDSVGERKHA